MIRMLTIALVASLAALPLAACGKKGDPSAPAPKQTAVR